MALRIQMPVSLPPAATPAGSPPSKTPTGSPSRAHSPRPSSRSERLLRDTLRKADERQLRDPPSGHRSPTSVDRERPFDQDPNELDEGLWLSNGARAAQILRRHSVSRPPSRCPSPLQMEDRAKPSPLAPPMSRSETAPLIAHSWGLHSLASMPIPPPNTPKAVSPRAVSHTPSSSLQRNPPVGPHEAVLRSRLENVLTRVNSAPHCRAPDVNIGSVRGKPGARARACSGTEVPAHTRSHSLADSLGEWPWAASFDAAEPGAPLTPPPTPPSSVSPLLPATPPSPFNARAANQICRQMPAYVSFQDVEGLGEPPHAEDDEGPDAGAIQDPKKWWNWPWGGRARAQSR